MNISHFFKADLSLAHVVKYHSLRLKKLKMHKSKKGPQVRGLSFEVKACAFWT